MKRLGLFLFNDSSNIVDDYIYYLLDDFTQNVNQICIVVNNLECKKSFERYTDDVIVNSNFEIEVEIWRDLLIIEVCKYNFKFFIFLKKLFGFPYLH